MVRMRTHFALRCALAPLAALFVWSCVRCWSPAGDESDERQTRIIDTSVHKYLDIAILLTIYYISRDFQDLSGRTTVSYYVLK